MLSSNLLKSKIPMLRVGGWVGSSWKFDAEFKFAKIQNSHVDGGWVESSWKIHAEFKFAKIENSHVEGGWVGGLRNFDAEFKFAKIQNCHVEGEGGASWNFDAD